MNQENFVQAYVESQAQIALVLAESLGLISERRSLARTKKENLPKSTTRTRMLPKNPVPPKPTTRTRIVPQNEDPPKPRTRTDIVPKNLDPPNPIIRNNPKFEKDFLKKL